MMGPVSADARLHPRYFIPAFADVIGDEVVLARPIDDISLGGCRFAGEAWETPGTEVHMVLAFPALKVNLPLQGVVVRSSDRDMAIRFNNLTDEQKWALRKHIRDVQTRAATE
jgi:hypothetical protein